MFLNFGIMSRNGAREDYDRVSFQTIHIIQLRDNPAPNVSGLDLAPNGIIPLEDLDRTTMEMLAPEPGPAPPHPVHRPPCSVGAMLFWISFRLINLRILQLRVRDRPSGQFPTRPRNLFQDFMATLPRPFPISAATGTPSPVSSPSSASTRSALSLSYHLQLAHHLQGRHLLTLC